MDEETRQQRAERLFREQGHLKGEDLRGVDLSEFTELRESDLAGADLSGARLPEQIDLPGSLARVSQSADLARHSFFFLTAFCGYSLLTIGMTKDVGLLTNTHTSRLPVLGADIPIVYFYIVAPILLVGFYAYFQVQLYRLLECLTKLPAFFPDGRPLDRKAHPWLLIGLIRRHLPQLKDDQPPLAWLQASVVVMLAWWSGPVTLFFFWGRALARHDTPLTAMHLLALAAATGLGLYTHRLALSTLRGLMPSAVALWLKILRAFLLQVGRWRRWPFRPLRWCTRVTVVVALFCLIAVSVSAIAGWPAREWFTREPDSALLKESPWAYYWQKRRQIILTKAIDFITADFHEQDVSTKTKDWLAGNKDIRERFPVPATRKYIEEKQDDFWRKELEASRKRVDRIKDSIEALKELVNRADLRGRNLKNASGYRAFLVGADLRGADLSGANLKWARLEGADLWDARLDNANLDAARLDRVDLVRAHMEGVSLMGASLPGAALREANLKGAMLWGAILEGASLREANLDGANMKYAGLLLGADLEGAYLRGAILEGAHFFGAELNWAHLAGC